MFRCFFAKSITTKTAVSRDILFDSVGVWRHASLGPKRSEKRAPGPESRLPSDALDGPPALKESLGKLDLPLPEVLRGSCPSRLLDKTDDRATRDSESLREL